MTYIIIELFPEPFILTNMDGEIWKTDLETAYELAAECQQGMVVPIENSKPDFSKPIPIYKMTQSQYDLCNMGSVFTDYSNNKVYFKLHGVHWIEPLVITDKEYYDEK